MEKPKLPSREGLRPPPEPVPLDPAPVVALGTALWALAFLALLPFADQLEEAGHGRWIPICGTGVVLGVVGWVYCRVRRTSGSDAGSE